MNQLPRSVATSFQLPPDAKFPPLPSEFRAPPGIDAVLGRKVAEGLQLTRASTIALTRLQLALAGGDRRQAMAAMDRLHLLDGAMEYLVEGLPQSARDTAEVEAPSRDDDINPAEGQSPRDEDPLTSLGKHLTDQKLALAFEKLALASGISGPDLVSQDHALAVGGGSPPRPQGGATDRKGVDATDNRPAPAVEDEPPLVDWHAFPEVQTVIWDRIPPKVWGALLSVLVAAGLVAAIVMATMI